jgi:uncharacterized protein YuzE
MTQDKILPTSNFSQNLLKLNTIKISDELIVDLSADGTVYGIELLNANEQLGRGEKGNVIISKRSNGQEIEVPIAVP